MKISYESQPTGTDIENWRVFYGRGSKQQAMKHIRKNGGTGIILYDHPVKAGILRIGNVALNGDLRHQQK